VITQQNTNQIQYVSIVDYVPFTFVSGACPSPDMRILLDDQSYIKAGELRVGMKVYTKHEVTMEYGIYEVIKARIVKQPTIKLIFGDLEFVCSKSHKFYDDGIWVDAENLTVGQFIDDREILEIVDDGELNDVVSLTIDDAHTYICEGFLSHNK
jgi:intein/homing endonuclease